MSLSLANKITISRILAVPFFISAVLYYSPSRDYLRYVALGIYVFASVSDLLDGYVARMRGELTEWGAVLDPLADKVLLASAYIFLFSIGHALPHLSFPIWLVVTVISRDAVLIMGTLLILVFHGRFTISVSHWGKAATFLQTFCVIGLLLQWSWTMVFWYFAFILTVISGLDYIGKGFNIMNTGIGKKI